MRIVLFMTRGMSLAAWEKNGSLERELALYAELAKYGCKTTIISWGDKQDKIIANRYPWLKVCANTWNLSQRRYEQLMPVLHAAHLIRADLIKSNQAKRRLCLALCTTVAKTFHCPLWLYLESAERRYGEIRCLSSSKN